MAKTGDDIPCLHEIKIATLPSQRAMWLDMRVHPDIESTLTFSRVVDIGRAVEPQDLQYAIQGMVDSTSSLRLRFSSTSHELQAWLRDFVQVGVDVLDFSQSPEPEVEAGAWIAQESKRSINATSPVLFRHTLIRLPDRSWWFHQHHHLIIDAYGMERFDKAVLSDLLSAEGKTGARRASDQAAYMRCIQEYSESASGHGHTRRVRYWSLRNPGVRASLSKHKTDRKLHNHIKSNNVLSGADVEVICAAANDLQISIPQLIICGVMLYLQRATGIRDIVVGLPVHGRTATSRGLIACCANVVPFIASGDHGASVRTYIQSVRQSLLTEMVLNNLRYEEVRHAMKVPVGEPQYDITLVVVESDKETESAAAATVVRGPRDQRPEETRLRIECNMRRQIVDVHLSGCDQSYEQWEIDEHVRNIGHVIVGMARGLDEAVLDIQLSPVRDETLNKFSVGEVVSWSASGDSNVINTILSQCKQYQTRVAIRDSEEEHSYCSIDRLSELVALEVIDRGICARSVVAIDAVRNSKTIVTMLGVLRAGCSYVMVDADLPAARKRKMLLQCAASAFITQSSAPIEANVLGVPTIYWDQCKANGGGSTHIVRARESEIGPRDLCYLMFTSGSAGAPKAVGVGHAALMNYCQYARQEFSLVSDDRVLQFANLSFDASVEEIFPTLMAGASIVMRDSAIPSPSALTDMAIAERITVLDLPTSYWRVWVGSIDDHALHALSIRLVVVGGERCDIESFREWEEVRSGRPIEWLNTYGPTEATVVASVYRANDSTKDLKHVPIGRPVANARIYVLDEYGQVAPIGIEGEIFIAGAGVAQGYVNQVELTEQRFVRDPFTRNPQERMYRTGDMGRWRSDGNLEFLGRRDLQVKIRGFRIELGEIEARLLSHPQVREAAVLAREDEPGNKRLVAYYTVRSEEQLILTEDLRSHLSSALPEYMVPAAYVRLQSLPLTVNGKLDRKGLPAPEADAYTHQQYEAPVGPVETALAQIWSEVLGVERVGRHDNFFELGGHSLLAIQVITRVSNLLDMNCAVASIFANPSLCEFVDFVLQEVEGHLHAGNHDD